MGGRVLSKHTAMARGFSSSPLATSFLHRLLNLRGTAFALTLFVLAGLCSHSALAQNTVSELLDAGGKKLSKAELVAAVSDASLAGPHPSGAQVLVTYKANGTLSGNVISSGGKNIGVFGTWAVDDSGTMCSALTVPGQNTQPTAGNCASYYKNGDQYYVSFADSERVWTRTITKLGK